MTHSPLALVSCQLGLSALRPLRRAGERHWSRVAGRISISSTPVGKKRAVLMTDFSFLVVTLIQMGYSQDSDRPSESGTFSVNTGSTGVTGPACFRLFCSLGGTDHTPQGSDRL